MSCWVLLSGNRFGCQIYSVKELGLGLGSDTGFKHSFGEVSEGKDLHICGRNIFNLTSIDSGEMTKEREPSS